MSGEKKYTITDVHKKLGSQIPYHTLSFSWVPHLRGAGLISQVDGPSRVQLTEADFGVLKQLLQLKNSGAGVTIIKLVEALLRESPAKPTDVTVATGQSIAQTPSDERLYSETEAAGLLNVKRDWIIAARTRLIWIMTGPSNGSSKSSVGATQRMYTEKDLTYLRRFMELCNQGLGNDRATRMVLDEAGLAAAAGANGNSHGKAPTPVPPALTTDSTPGMLDLTQPQNRNYLQTTLLLLQHELVGCSAVAERIAGSVVTRDAAQLNGALRGVLGVLHELTDQVMEGNAATEAVAAAIG